MANPSDILRKRRMDLSPYLFTFLRDDHPQETLHEVLTTGKLMSKDNDFICFTDAPITCYLPTLEYFEEWKNKGRRAMFSMYGIGICRDWLIKTLGARPVIYGDDSEKELLHESLQWRFLTLDVENYDFSWLREWRIPQKEINLFSIPKEHIIVIVPTVEELKDFVVGWDFDVDFAEYESGELGHPYIIEKSTENREWKGFALNQIQQVKNDFELIGKTANQIIGEKIE